MKRTSSEIMGSIIAEVNKAVGKTTLAFVQVTDDHYQIADDNYQITKNYWFYIYKIGNKFYCQNSNPFFPPYQKQLNKQLKLVADTLESKEVERIKNETEKAKESLENLDDSTICELIKNYRNMNENLKESLCEFLGLFQINRYADNEKGLNEEFTNFYKSCDFKKILNAGESGNKRLKDALYYSVSNIDNFVYNTELSLRILKENIAVFHLYRYSYGGSCSLENKLCLMQNKKILKEAETNPVVRENLLAVIYGYSHNDYSSVEATEAEVEEAIKNFESLGLCKVRKRLYNRILKGNTESEENVFDLPNELGFETFNR